MSSSSPWPPDRDDIVFVSPQVVEERYGWQPPPDRPRFQHRYRLPVVLFVLTLFTTSLAGACHYDGYYAMHGTASVFEQVASLSEVLAILVSPSFLVPGFWYSLPLIVILGAHEFGHYFYCRVHRVDASLPFFLPAPFFTGTLGAVIRIKEVFPSKQALFDIGVAGPIAGFVALLPFLYFGLMLSAPAQFPASPDSTVIYFGEPALFRALAWLRFGTLPEGMDLTLHPMGFAAWFGMLATALNLLPFGQLDGGHIAYAALGRRAGYVSLATLVITVGLAFVSSGWTSVAVMMCIMAWFLGVRHPRIVDEHVPLGPGRTLVAVFAVLMFALCFTPVPIEFFVGGK